jgi:hypothetical protein
MMRLTDTGASEGIGVKSGCQPCNIRVDATDIEGLATSVAIIRMIALRMNTVKDVAMPDGLTGKPLDGFSIVFSPFKEG